MHCQEGNTDIFFWVVVIQISAIMTVIKHSQKVARDLLSRHILVS